MNLNLKIEGVRWSVYLALALAFCIPMSVSAKDFYSTSLIDIPAETGNQRIQYGPVKDSRLLYVVTDIQNHEFGSLAYTESLYVYDVAKKESTQLIKLNFKEADFSPALIQIPYNLEFATGLSKSYVIVSGHLLVTDGTQNGTKILGNFGTSYCCNVGSQVSRIFSLGMVGDKLYFTYLENIDASNPFYQFPTSQAVWVSDGSVEGTRKVSQSITSLYGPEDLFVNQYVDSGSVFYFADGGIWKIGINETSPFIPLDLEFVKSVKFSGSGIQTTVNGNFFCGPSADGGRALWRFSNSGVLKAVMQGCGELFSHGNRLFVISNNEVYESDGRVLGSKLLFRFDERVRSSLVLFCPTDNSVNFLSRYSFPVRQFFQVDAAGSVVNMTDKFTEFDSGSRRRNLHCLNEHILVENRNKKIISLYNLDTVKEARVLDRRTRNGRRDDSEARAIFQPIGATYFSRRAPIFLHKTASPVLSSILSELMNDEP